MTTPWQPLADRLLALLRARLDDDLVAVWVHGSAAVGGFVPGRSDLDVLVVVADDADRDWRVLGRAVAALGEPALPLELSVVRSAAARAPRAPWPFLVHVSTGSSTPVLLDDGRGDADLLLHLAVARAAGLSLHGPAPVEVVPAPDRDEVLAQLAEELAWGVDNADEAYAVLNACRALRYAETGDLVGKVEGGEWLRERRPEHRVVVDRALEAQRQGVALEGAGMAGRALVQDVLDDIAWG